MTVIVTLFCVRSNMKCDNCEHQRVCHLYRQHISYLEHEGIQITIDKCLEFDEINK
jgi:hypothetical protein